MLSSSSASDGKPAKEATDEAADDEDDVEGTAQYCFLALHRFTANHSRLQSGVLHGFLACDAVIFRKSSRDRIPFLHINGSQGITSRDGVAEEDAVFFGFVLVGFFSAGGRDGTLIAEGRVIPGGRGKLSKGVVSFDEDEEEEAEEEEDEGGGGVGKMGSLGGTFGTGDGRGAGTVTTSTKSSSLRSMISFAGGNVGGSGRRLKPGGSGGPYFGLTRTVTGTNTGLKAGGGVG